MTIYQEAMDTLKLTSRTFYIPIIRLPNGLREAVASGYLCLRAIDEVEDHPDMDNSLKARILNSISLILQAQTSEENFSHHDLSAELMQFQDLLPEVTLRIGEWACHAPKFIAPRIWEATASMADRMAHWATTGWNIISQADLDRYTYSVAGAVGLMLCDIWAWFEKVQIHRTHAIQFGRGLQTVNILRNREEDIERGVDFFPKGWSEKQMYAYAHKNLDGFSSYVDNLQNTSVNNFIAIPRALAYATLEALECGEEKLSRQAVLNIVRQIDVG